MLIAAKFNKDNRDGQPRLFKRIGDSSPCYAKMRCQGRIDCNAI